VVVCSEGLGRTESGVVRRRESPGDRVQVGGLPRHELAVDHTAVPRDHEVARPHLGDQRVEHARPVERIAARPVYRRSRLLHEVADDPHAFGRHEHDEVGVGVRPRLRVQLDHAPAEVELGHPLDRMRRGHEPHVVPPPVGLAASVIPPCGEPRLLVSLEVAGDAGVAVDRDIRRRARTEHLVAERVVEVRVRVDEPDHRPAEPRMEVGQDLLALRGLGARVDDEEAVVALDDDDGEVERAAAPLVDAMRDGGPGGHPPSLAMRLQRHRALVIGNSEVAPVPWHP